MANYDCKNLFQSQNLIWGKRKKKKCTKFFIEGCDLHAVPDGFCPVSKTVPGKLFVHFQPFLCPPATAWKLKGSLGNDDGDGDGNENGKKAIGFDW